MVCIAWSYPNSFGTSVDFQTRGMDLQNGIQTTRQESGLLLGYGQQWTKGIEPRKKLVGGFNSTHLKNMLVKLDHLHK